MPCPDGATRTGRGDDSIPTRPLVTRAVAVGEFAGRPPARAAIVTVCPHRRVVTMSALAAWRPYDR